MPPKTAISEEQVGKCCAAAAPVSDVSKDDLLTALAEHMSALLAELNTAFIRIERNLDTIQQSLESQGTRPTCLEDRAQADNEHLEKLDEKLHAKVADLERAK